jgi:hypothetical protein
MESMGRGGTKSGDPGGEVVAQGALADEPTTGELVICSAWGPDADWVRNLQNGPVREVRVGRDRFVPLHRLLTDDEACSVGVAFRQAHPWRLRLIGTTLGWGDLRTDEAVRRFVQRHPFVGLRPTREAV